MDSTLITYKGWYAIKRKQTNNLLSAIFYVLAIVSLACICSSWILFQHARNYFLTKTCYFVNINNSSITFTLLSHKHFLAYSLNSISNSMGYQMPTLDTNNLPKVTWFSIGFVWVYAISNIVSHLLTNPLNRYALTIYD